MKNYRYLIVVIVLLALLFGGVVFKFSNLLVPSHDTDVIFQVSTFDALSQGSYDGDISFNELREKGDFGLGTFNGLDGEMIEINGDFYQIKVDGVAYHVDGSILTPFSIVTYFEKDKEVTLSDPLNYTELENYLEDTLPTKNIFYAIKIEGVFKYVETRSVPKQSEPYPPLSEVVKNQVVFKFHNVKGTMIGFWMPAYIGGVNTPGYHFHFITEDRTKGGHVLECTIQDVDISIDYTADLLLNLPKES